MKLFQAEDMDYKLNPDAPEFVPVSSPPARNHAQRFLNMETDDLISSSPQKYKETIDNVDVPDENDFTNEIKMQSADLSKLDNPLGITLFNNITIIHNNTLKLIKLLLNSTFKKTYKKQVYIMFYFMLCHINI